jgi:hypothetical protein
LKPIAGLFYRRWLIVFVWLSTFGFSAATFAVTAAAEPADVEVFVLPGGPHCTDAKAFLQTLKQEQPALNIRVRDVMLEPAALALAAFCQRPGVKTARVSAFSWRHGS